ncbi:MAG: hypothetical protein WC450_10700 [Candidatus Omnitrophota bacterium]
MIPTLAFAALTLSVTPSEGGSSIRFGRVDTLSSEDKEVRVRVNSDEGQQYQVFQRMTPLVNEKGETLDHPAILTGGLLGSNTGGTLYVQDIEQIGLSEQQIYSSDQAGTSDSFVVFYKVDPNALTVSGSFQGQMLYTVRPIGGGNIAETIITVTLECGGELKLETTGNAGPARVRITTDQRPLSDATFSIVFTNNIEGNAIKIYQQIDTLPRDELMQPVEAGLIQYLALGGERGDILQEASGDLRPEQVLIYEGTASHDTIGVNYSVNQDLVQNYQAGNYEGTARYIIESRQGDQEIDVNLELVVAPVFELNVEYPSEGMSFHGTLETDPPQIKDIKVAVKTNLGKPYVVNQILQAPLTNEEGEEFSSEFFTFREELIDGDGSVQHDDFSPVSKGEVPLYVSDDQGSSAVLNVSYRMKPYPNMQAGNYKVQVMYSLGAI